MCLYLFMKRLCHNLFHKHPGTTKNWDYLVLIDNRIHYFALSSQIRPQTITLHSYDNIHITLHAKGIQSDLTESLLRHSDWH